MVPSSHVTRLQHVRDALELWELTTEKYYSGWTWLAVNLRAGARSLTASQLWKLFKPLSARWRAHRRPRRRHAQHVLVVAPKNIFPVLAPEQVFLRNIFVFGVQTNMLGLYVSIFLFPVNYFFRKLLLILKSDFRSLTYFLFYYFRFPIILVYFW